MMYVTVYVLITSNQVEGNIRINFSAENIQISLLNYTTISIGDNHCYC